MNNENEDNENARRVATIEETLINHNSTISRILAACRRIQYGWTPKASVPQAVSIDVGMHENELITIRHVPVGTPIEGFEDLGLVETEDDYALYVGQIGMNVCRETYERIKANSN